jgi:hypothetical protein
VIPSLVEVALRALLVAAAVWAGLRLMRVRDVLAQKAAWSLVLAAAITMPALLPLVPRLHILPAGLTLTAPQKAIEHTKAIAPSRALNAQRAAAAPSLPSAEFAGEGGSAAATAKEAESIAIPVTSSARGVVRTPPPLSGSEPGFPRRSFHLDLRGLAWMAYLTVSAVLLLRLMLGLGSTISLWLDAEPIETEHALGLGLRMSRAVTSPVTIGSGVVLPRDYDEWDTEKLRIVLAHERSHIRQGDFYLQLLAGVYAALFWFSPLGWWLKRTLSDLGEALSDRAGLEEAASRSAYAQILLEFAGMPRTTLMGVAMARTSSLSGRIERLLNDTNFRQAFSLSRRRAFATALLVPTALFAATSLARVKAASQPPQESAAPASGVSHPDDGQAAIAPPAPVSSIEPVSPIAPPAVEIARPVDAVPSVIAAPQAPQAPVAPPPPADNDNVTVGAGQSMTIVNGRRGPLYLRSGSGSGFAFSFRSDDDDDSYALVTEPRGGVRFSGDWMDGRREEIDRASRIAHGGKFLWFSHDGKSYVIDDPGIIAGIEALYKPIDDLGRQQEELGKKQEELGRQQEELGRKQEQASVPAPDVSREIAEIKAALASLEAKKGGTVTQDDLSDLQGRIGDLQGRLGDIQGKIGDIQGQLGEEQGRLGEKQGELGAEQGRLGEEQGRLAQEADRKVRSIIDDSLKNGKARPVE